VALLHSQQDLNTPPSDRKEPLFGSTIIYATHDRWYPHPVIALLKDSTHHKNLSEGTMKCSLLVFPLTPKSVSPSSVPLPKVNIIGTAREIAETEDRFVAFDAF
jgi:hypothetical protein